MAGKTSRKGKGYYATYKALNQCQKNRKIDLERHLKDHPSDKQAVEAAKNPKGHVRTSGSVKRWTTSSRWMAQIERQLKGYWNAVHNGGATIAAAQPEFINFGDKVEVPLKDQKPKAKKQNRVSKKPKGE